MKNSGKMFFEPLSPLAFSVTLARVGHAALKMLVNEEVDDFEINAVKTLNSYLSHLLASAQVSAGKLKSQGTAPFDAKESFETLATMESWGANIDLTKVSNIKRLNKALGSFARKGRIERNVAEEVLSCLEEIRPLYNFDLSKRHLDTVGMFPNAT